MSNERETTQASTRVPRRRFKRQLTPFLCQQMLYEYATERLDLERKTDMDIFLATDPASQRELTAVRQGLHYAEQLSQVEISPELMQRLSSAENFLSFIHRAFEWDEWPETLRWSVSALAISVLVAGVVTVIPWKKLSQISRQQRTSIELAQIPQAPKADLAVVETNVPDLHDGEIQPDSELAASEENETSGDEHDDGSGFVVPTDGDSSLPPAGVPIISGRQIPRESTPAAGASQQKGVAPTNDVVEEITSDTVENYVVGAVPGPMKQAAPSPGKRANETTTAAAAVDNATVSRGTKTRGFVYRAFMNLSNLESVTTQITQGLIDLGSQKAGEVPLGWRRGTGSYFHFTAPEANEQKVLDLLRAYGPVRFSKDPHPRQMPIGQIRFILWIEPTMPEAPSLSQPSVVVDPSPGSDVQTDSSTGTGSEPAVDSEGQ